LMSRYVNLVHSIKGSFEKGRHSRSGWTLDGTRMSRRPGISWYDSFRDDLIKTGLNELGWPVEELHRYYLDFDKRMKHDVTSYGFALFWDVASWLRRVHDEQEARNKRCMPYLRNEGVQNRQGLDSVLSHSLNRG